MDAPADPRCLQLSELGDCAYRLGMVFGREAEQAETREERIELYKLFERCFFSVRVSMALQLRLARTPAAASVREASDREADDHEAPDWEDRRERFTDRDRETDRETERASLPVLLRTLEGVAADAEARPGPKPAALPTLRELLAHVKSTPAAKPAAQGLRARLASSGATATLTLSPSPRPKPSLASPLRRATGPPRPK